MDISKVKLEERVIRAGWVGGFDAAVDKMSVCLFVGRNALNDDHKTF